jgi:UDP-glucose-4-epimerase GalE
MENKKAFITGGAGYLGSHLAKSLKKSGWTVIGFGHKRHTMNPYYDMMFYGDIRDQATLDDIFRRVKIDVVFHLASRIESGISFEEPTKFYSVNTGGTTILLNCMNRAGIKNIVFSSTAAVYKGKNSPIKEDDEKTNNSPYGYSKLCAEYAIKDSNINYVIFRYFNLTGADLDGEFGESHEPETHLIPRILQNLNNFEINGNDYETPDGTCVRDYIHVTDVAEAHVTAADHLLKGKDSIILNLGTGKGQSILSIIEELEKIICQKICYKINPRRSGDSPSLIADITLAEKVLNFKPKHDIVTILKTAYEWQLKND